MTVYEFALIEQLTKIDADEYAARKRFSFSFISCEAAMKKKWRMGGGIGAGEVYLVFRNETRRYPLPDRAALTQLAAVRRMFLGCFPDRLTPAWFENTYNRLYVLDHASRHFYELEDVRY